MVENEVFKLKKNWRYFSLWFFFGTAFFLIGCASGKQNFVASSTDDVYTLYSKVNALDSATDAYVKNRYLTDLLLNAQKNEKIGQYPYAIVDLLEALKYDSSKVLLYSLARNFFYLGKIGLAFDYAYKSFLKDTNFELSLDLLVTLLQKLEKYSEAHYFSQRLLNVEKPNFRESTIERHFLILEKLDTTYLELLNFCDLFPRTKKYSFILERKIYVYFNKGDTLNEFYALDTLLAIEPEYFNTKPVVGMRYLNLLLVYSQFDRFLNFWNDFVYKLGLPEVKIFFSSLDSTFRKVYKNNPQFVENCVQVVEKRFSMGKELALTLSNLYYSIGNNSKAMEYERWVLENNDISLDNLIEIANNRYLCGAKSSAIEILEKYFEKFSDSVNFLLYLGNLCLLVDSLESAEKVLLKALKIDSSDDRICSNLGWLYDKLGKYPLSNYYYERALNLNPNNETTLNNYAYALIERGERLDYARKLIESALQISPNNPSFLDTYGWLFYKLGEYQRALQFLLESIKNGVESYEQYLHLAIIYYEIGEKKLSEENFLKANEIEPNNEKVLNKMKEIIK